ncbi:hypothetical protein DPMN_026173 [Dreissena polymorpha]|uniref:Uncharacterized protein n=1 Tax=Dreissena polymorpha TaxID=45954 RepID=A0A9D4LSW3_DREPO|nr:hypothetical protein DPMN_026173 [Dreissena polymorpha]
MGVVPVGSTRWTMSQIGVDMVVVEDINHGTVTEIKPVIAEVVDIEVEVVQVVQLEEMKEIMVGEFNKKLVRDSQASMIASFVERLAISDQIVKSGKPRKNAIHAMKWGIAEQNILINNR